VIAPGPSGRLLAFVFAVASVACGNLVAPSEPVAVVFAPAKAVAFEGESGGGDGQIRERSRASAGRTLHLGPGESRRWTFSMPAAPAAFGVSLIYANGQEGENEMLTVMLDGVRISRFRNRDSGDAVEGWNTFITDPAGRSMITTGTHVLVLEVEGGDGCVEIDRIEIKPEPAP
jgi:hypothetical protein